MSLVRYFKSGILMLCVHVCEEGRSLICYHVCMCVSRNLQHHGRHQTETVGWPDATQEVCWSWLGDTGGGVPQVPWACQGLPWPWHHLRQPEGLRGGWGNEETWLGGQGEEMKPQEDEFHVCSLPNCTRWQPGRYCTSQAVAGNGLVGCPS